MAGGRPEQSFEDRVLAVVRSLQPGEVASYGEVAEEAGFPGAARAVGNVMATSEGVPWWRVIQASGRLPRAKEAEAARHLRAEGVALSADGSRVAGRGRR